MPRATSASWFNRSSELREGAAIPAHHAETPVPLRANTADEGETFGHVHYQPGRDRGGVLTRHVLDLMHEQGTREPFVLL